VISGGWDLCLDFTSNDRSALATAVSRAKTRTTFAAVQRLRTRAMAYTRYAESAVRERHTIDHYLDLVNAVIGQEFGAETDAQPSLRIPPETRADARELLHARGVTGPFALLHPGTARVEKYWTVEGWTALQRRLSQHANLSCVLTGGNDPFELEHVARIAARSAGRALNLAGEIDLLTLAALAEQARIVISCDTAIVHLASAFRTPQIALFGPTNPFHWRPRHPRAVVLSAAHPGSPLTEFQPRMRGASMEGLSTETVVRATERLLASCS
jgi:ADP-heptose:LPS heptosyltransferase